MFGNLDDFFNSWTYLSKYTKSTRASLLGVCLHVCLLLENSLSSVGRQGDMRIYREDNL